MLYERTALSKQSDALPLSRALLMEYRTTMEHLSPSTINVRMSATRKLVGEARRNGMIGREEADNLTDIPNVGQKGTRLGNWLTREQAKEQEERQRPGADKVFTWAFVDTDHGAVPGIRAGDRNRGE